MDLGGGRDAAALHIGGTGQGEHIYVYICL